MLILIYYYYLKDVMKAGDLKIVNKGTELKKDLQTEADRCAQLCIVNSLQKQFDNVLTIIAEEV
jgi:3'(2'), 5'-bisphosphate nucleotidase